MRTGQTIAPLASQELCMVIWFTELTESNAQLTPRTVECA
ncbi:hypothetical protein MAHJHV55_52010 [Mycobacterium avium subsp. hominissuis]